MFTDVTLYDFLIYLWLSVGGYVSIHSIYSTWKDWDNLH